MSSWNSSRRRFDSTASPENVPPAIGGDSKGSAWPTPVDLQLFSHLPMRCSDIVAWSALCDVGCVFHFRGPVHIHLYLFFVFFHHRPAGPPLPAIVADFHVDYRKPSVTRQTRSPVADESWTAGIEEPSPRDSCLSFPCPPPPGIAIVEAVFAPSPKRLSSMVSEPLCVQNKSSDGFTSGPIPVFPAWVSSSVVFPVNSSHRRRILTSGVKPGLRCRPSTTGVGSLSGRGGRKAPLSLQKKTLPAAAAFGQRWPVSV